MVPVAWNPSWRSLIISLCDIKKLSKYMAFCFGSGTVWRRVMTTLAPRPKPASKVTSWPAYESVKIPSGLPFRNICTNDSQNRESFAYQYRGCVKTFYISKTSSSSRCTDALCTVCCQTLPVVLSLGWRFHLMSLYVYRDNEFVHSGHWNLLHFPSTYLLSATYGSPWKEESQ